MKPKVSIGLPVYNGQQYLRQALESLLGQTLGDFELIIADNASTDDTQAICLEYAARDKRIKYHRNSLNVGGSPNANLVFRLSAGEYFMWGSDDDIRDAEYLEKCAAVLDGNTDLVLCYTKTKYIDEHGAVIKVGEDDEAKGRGLQASERFKDLIRIEHHIEPELGLIRSDVLKRTPLEGSYADSDRVLVAELGLYGPFYQIPEYLFYRRLHPNQSTGKYPLRQHRMQWIDPRRAARVSFPHFRELKELFAAVTRVPLSPLERMCCYVHCCAWVLRYRERLGGDLEWAARQTLGPMVKRYLFSG